MAYTAAKSLSVVDVMAECWCDFGIGEQCICRQAWLHHPPGPVQVGGAGCSGVPPAGRERLPSARGAPAHTRRQSCCAPSAGETDEGSGTELFLRSLTNLPFAVKYMIKGNCCAPSRICTSENHLMSLVLCVQLDMEGLYEQEGRAPLQHLQSALTDERKKAGAHASGDSLVGVVWTPSMRRMYTLLDRYACVYYSQDTTLSCTLCGTSPPHTSELQSMPCCCHAACACPPLHSLLCCSAKCSWSCCILCPP